MRIHRPNGFRIDLISVFLRKRGYALKDQNTPENAESTKGSKKAKRISLPIIAGMFVLQLALSLMICVALIFHTDVFSTLKKYVINSLMETKSHQYVARLLMSDAEIKQLTAPIPTVSTPQQKIKPIKPTSGKTDITIIRVDESRYTGYVLEEPDPRRVKVAMTKKVGVVGEFTSAMARENGAIAAINGGGFSVGASTSDNAQFPTNFVMHNGKVIWMANNWNDYKTVNVIALDKSGQLIVGTHSINELENLGVQEAVTMPKNGNNDFRPLIVNGAGMFEKGSYESRAPRTIIAQQKNGTILLVVLNGRTILQPGATYYEVQQMLLDKSFSPPDNPVITAAILDGGGSSTMYYDGQIMNHPSAQFGERPVATAFYVEQ